MIGVLLLLLCFSITCFAGAYKSGKYTRMGAEYAGNESGEITAFEGVEGIKCPSGWQPGDYLPSPWPDEKPLFKIDHTNVDQYKDKLTPGQIALLKKATHLYMNIYPCHRIYEMPEEYLAAVEKNIETAHLDENKNLQGFNGGIPFPFPKNGDEAVWNLKSSWSGDDLVLNNSTARVVSPSGKVRRIRQTTKIIYVDEDYRLFLPPIKNKEMVRSMLIAWTVYPPDQAGSSLLVKSYIDDTRKSDVWQYMPSLRRVRRIPSQDSGFQGTGESIDADMIVGIAAPIDEWNWKLVGKKENYVLANNFEVWKVGTCDEEVLPWGVNPELLRYELRRVWIVEATPTEETKNHPYSKKVGYFNEDNWNQTLDDRYDRRGNLWRMGQTAQICRYCDKYREQILVYMVNLESGRYELAGGCRTEDTKMTLVNLGQELNEYTVTELRKGGR